MIRLARVRLVLLGALVLACSREQARDSATPGDTLAAPPPVQAPVPAVPADTVRPDTVAPDTIMPRDTAAAAVPPPRTNARPARQAPDTPPSVAPPAPKPAPVAKPNIDPRPAKPPPRVLPAPAQDTARAPATQSPLRDAYHRAPKDTVSLIVYNGWKQYNLNCARCHGEDVLGTTIAPHLTESLKPDGPINTKAIFLNVVCHGRPEKGMPAWCPLGLDTTKIEQVYSYVKGRSEGKLRPGRPALRE